MSEGESLNFWFLIGCLVLVVSSLAARRLSLSVVVRALLGWAAIAAVIYVVVVNRFEIRNAFSGVTSTLGLDDQRVVGNTVRIRMAPDGHFWARVTLNGVERTMLIDSGATTTAISETTAAEIGLPEGGYPVELETANGTVTARHQSIQRVGLGDLETEDLGVVVQESLGDTDLLGMNFLSRLKRWHVEGNILVLEPK